MRLADVVGTAANEREHPFGGLRHGPQDQSSVADREVAKSVASAADSTNRFRVLCRTSRGVGCGNRRTT
jgi:ribosomal protein L2